MSDLHHILFQVMSRLSASANAHSERLALVTNTLGDARDTSIRYDCGTRKESF
ncbi:MAG TPA: hypothetical protein VF725_11270 [Ktedonobacterales bacterium]